MLHYNQALTRGEVWPRTLLRKNTMKTKDLQYFLRDSRLQYAYMSRACFTCNDSQFSMCSIEMVYRAYHVELILIETILSICE